MRMAWYPLEIMHFLNCGKSYDSASMTAVHIMVLPENVKTTYSDGDYEFIVVKNGEQKSEHIFCGSK